MLRKVFRTGNSIVISLPREALDYLNIHEGAEVSVELDRVSRRLVISPVNAVHLVPGVDETFTHQIAEFISQYRPVLEQLSGR